MGWAIRRLGDCQLGGWAIGRFGDWTIWQLGGGSLLTVGGGSLLTAGGGSLLTVGGGNFWTADETENTIRVETVLGRQIWEKDRVEQHGRVERCFLFCKQSTIHKRLCCSARRTSSAIPRTMKSGWPDPRMHIVQRSYRLEMRFGLEGPMSLCVGFQILLAFTITSTSASLSSAWGRMRVLPHRRRISGSISLSQWTALLYRSL